MRDWSPKSIWDRLRRTIEGFMGGEEEVDETSILFHLVFIAPIFIGLVGVFSR